MDNLAARLREEMVSALAAEGALRSERWLRAFRTVPRHEFVPEIFVLLEDRATYRAVGREDGEEWLRLAYIDDALTTQLGADPGAWRRARENGLVSGPPTSSSSAPGLMASMLEALDVTDDSSVIELGTGTGYNAALLCEGLGGQQVTSVDIDPGLVSRARQPLHKLGYRPDLSTADGDSLRGRTFGHLVATYGVPLIPSSWLSIVEPGGVIVAPLHREHPVGAMVQLRAEEGHRALGRFLPFYGAFMPTRPRPVGNLAGARRAYEQGRGESRTSDLPGLNVGMGEEAWPFCVVLLLGDLSMIDLIVEDSDETQHWLIAPDGSWAIQHGDEQRVTEGGPRRLWADLEQAERQWRELEKPDRERLGLTVTEQRQEVWIDSPDQIIQSADRTGGTVRSW